MKNPKNAALDNRIKEMVQYAKRRAYCRPHTKKGTIRAAASVSGADYMALAKHLIRTGVGLGAAVLGIGALVYECALNTKLNAFFVSKFDHPDPEQEALYNGETYTDGRAWFNEHMGEDRMIFTEKTGRIHAYIFMNEKPSHRWAICCHGYNSSPQGTTCFTQHFFNMGFNVITPSMRGWGNDETRYCTMAWHDKDVLLAWIDFVNATDPDAEIILHGYSMGAATVMLATGEKLPENVKAAVADCGFTNCYEQFRHVLKSYTGLPPFPLLDAMNLVSMVRAGHDFRKNSPIDAVRRSVTPTVFLHGTADDFVPFYMMDELYEACAAPKAKQPIEGGFHATSVLKDPETYWKAVDAFLADKI